MLREIIGQEFEVSDDDVPRVRRGRGVRQIVSAHDPEMRHGRKTPAQAVHRLQAARRRRRRGADPDRDRRSRPATSTTGITPAR